MFTLPVAQYPDVTPPTVVVTAVYPGANALTVRDTVAAPIEEQVSGVEGMMYMSSQCTNDGTYTLTVTFKLGHRLGHGPGAGAEPRVSLAQPVIPALVQREGINVKKQSPNTLMIVNLVSPGRPLPRHLPEQLRDHRDPRRAGPAARAWRGRLPRPAGLQHAGLARPGQAGVARG